MPNAGLAHRDKICFKFVYDTTSDVEKRSVCFLELSCRRFCRCSLVLPQSATVFTLLRFLFCTTPSVFAGPLALDFENSLLFRDHPCPVVTECGATAMVLV